MCAYNAILLRYTLRTIAITNQKGGSGKTTTAVNLAAALTERDHRVLLLDLDPQASASAWLGLRNGDRGLLDVFTDNVHLADLTRNSRIPNLDLIPSSTWLIGVDKALAADVGCETLLRLAFARLPHDWDYILVDCPPSLGASRSLCQSRRV
jgi:chromosome partitioning protein